MYWRLSKKKEGLGKPLPSLVQVLNVKYFFNIYVLPTLLSKSKENISIIKSQIFIASKEKEYENSYFNT